MAKKRASGEGSIRKRSDGRWEGRYIAGHDNNGKPIRKNVLGKSQAEVRERLKYAIEVSQQLDISRATAIPWVLGAKPGMTCTPNPTFVPPHRNGIGTISDFTSYPGWETSNLQSWPAGTSRKCTMK